MALFNQSFFTLVVVPAVLEYLTQRHRAEMQQELAEFQLKKWNLLNSATNTNEG
ncbi:unnamed protein product [Rhodiola kirilowii]